jgi:hypothetical protein
VYTRLSASTSRDGKAAACRALEPPHLKVAEKGNIVPQRDVEVPHIAATLNQKLPHEIQMRSLPLDHYRLRLRNTIDG